MSRCHHNREHVQGDALDAEIDVMAVATQSVAALVTEMVRGGWDAVRGAFARFLHRDGQAADRQLALFDEAAQTLASGRTRPTARRGDAWRTAWSFNWLPISTAFPTWRTNCALCCPMTRPRQEHKARR